MHRRGQGCAVGVAGGAAPRRRVLDPQGAGGRTASQHGFAPFTYVDVQVPALVLPE